MASPKVLIVDDCKEVRWSLSELLRRQNIDVIEAADGATTLSLVERECPDVMLLDVRLPDADGMGIMRRALELDAGLPVVLITGFGSIHGATQALKLGAFDYLTKPFDHSDVIRTVEAALAGHVFRRQTHGFNNSKSESLLDRMGHSSEVRRLAMEVARIAPTDFSVVIVGETGAGKEVVAQAIHAQSRRSSGPFLAVDCGAIPETLIESELFGHEKGAFTGADRKRIGKFEAACGGSLLLDEITNLPLGMQSKLLRALQEKQIYRIGGTSAVQVDTRVIAATNEDLRSLVAAKSFRSDLFHRLSEYAVSVPVLRDRQEDIPFLAHGFLRVANRELGKNIFGFTDSVMEALLAHAWPGNVRELRNVVRRAVLLADRIIDKDHIDLPVPGPNVLASLEIWRTLIVDDGLPLREIVQRSAARVERAVLEESLRKTGGNKAKAARMLQVDYKTIHTKLKRYKIQVTRRP